MALAKADYYFGAMLSQLINSGFAPAIFDESESRRIYSLKNDLGTFQIYAKYRSEPNQTKGEKKKSKLWQFKFSPDEIEKIKEYDATATVNQYFALICGYEKVKGGEIAILSLNELKTCLDIAHDRPSYRLTVKAVKGSPYLSVYGTGLADKKGEKDTTIKIERDMKARLETLSEVSAKSLTS